MPLLWVKVHELLGRAPEGSTARFVKDGTLPGQAQRRHRLPARKLKGARHGYHQLEHDMNELCHEWMHGKAPTDGVFGTVQAAARVFIFQALSAWTVLESTGQTEQLARPTSTPGCAASSKARSRTCRKSPAPGCRSRSTDRAAAASRRARSFVPTCASASPQTCRNTSCPRLASGCRNGGPPHVAPWRRAPSPQAAARVRRWAGAVRRDMARQSLLASPSVPP
jgi:hypothetical protein